MRKHIIIIALIWLFVGIIIGAFFIYGHIHFFSVSSPLFRESSVLEPNLSFLQRWRESFDTYMNFFGSFGINPLVSLITVISAIVFGYGLLKLREWARMFGFLLIAVNFISSVYGMIEGRFSISISLQILLCGYMWWVFTSPETIRLINGRVKEVE